MIGSYDISPRQHLKDNLEINIENDGEFTTSNIVYSAVVTEMNKKGFGCTDHKLAIRGPPEINNPMYIATNPITPTGYYRKLGLTL